MVAPEGYSEAIATNCALGASPEKRTPLVRVTFRLNERDEGRPQFATWDGYFTEKAAERTIDSLRAMGWKGIGLQELDNLDEDACLRLIGNTVSIKIEHEEYTDKEGKPRVAAKVRFVNPLRQQRAAFKDENRMMPDELSAFSDRMRGLCSALLNGATPVEAPARSPIPDVPRGTQGEESDDFLF